MDEKYLINDNRSFNAFKKKSFSGFKKNDILNAVLKAIESKKVENACHWTTECILSGYAHILWEKLIIFSCKIIHINNPKLPSYLNRVLSLEEYSKNILAYLPYIHNLR